MPDTDNLAEAERRCRVHADFLHVPGQDHLMLSVLLAEYDRRGQIEQRAREELRAQEANSVADTGFLPALEAVRFIVGGAS